MLVIAGASYAWSIKIPEIARHYPFWLAALVGFITLAAILSVRFAKRVSYLSRRLFSVTKFVCVCVLLVALLGVVIQLSSHGEGVTILAFDDDTNESKYNGKAIADSLQVELLRIQEILARARPNIESERLKSMALRQESERSSNSLRDIGTVGVGEAKISIGAVLLACKRFWPIGDSGTVITGGVQRFGQSVRILARLESNSEVHGYEITRTPKTEDEILDMIHQLAFKIEMGLQSPEHPVSAKTSEGFQNFTEALASYDRFLSTGEMANLDSAKQSCLNAFICEIGYTKLFLLLTSIGISYSEVKDYQSAAELFEKAALLEPNNATALNNLGLMLARLQRTEEARAAFNKAKSVSEKSAEITAAYDTNIGDAHYYANHLVDAEQNYNEALANNPDYSLAHLGLANVLVLKGEYTSARQHLEAAVLLQPNAPEPHLRLGDLFQTMAEYDQAQSEYIKATALDNENAEAFNGLGNIALSMGDLDVAMTQFHLSIDLAAKYSSPHVGLGYVLRGKGDVEGALRELTLAAQLDPLDADAHCALGEFFLFREEVDQAAQEFHRAIELLPQSERAHLDLGDVLRIQGKFDEAKHEYSLAERASSKSYSVHLAMGDLYIDTHDYEAAEREFGTAVQIAPKSPWPYVKLGGLYRDRGEIDASRKAYRSAIDMAPQLAEGYTGLADAFYNLGDYQSAIAQYSIATQKAPGYLDPYNGRGNAFYAIGDYEKAAAEYQRALEISPLSSESHASLGDIHCRGQQYDKAFEEYSTAIKNDARNSYPETQLAGLFLMKEKLQDAKVHSEAAFKLRATEWHNAFIMGVVLLLDNQQNKAEKIWNELLRTGKCRGIDDKLDRVMISCVLYGNKDEFDLLQKELSSLPVRPAGLLSERKDLLNVALLRKSDRFTSCRQLFDNLSADPAKSITGKRGPKPGENSRGEHGAPQPSRR
jgi:tetratricopeptide (TPR) repeat protein